MRHQPLAVVLALYAYEDAEFATHERLDGARITLKQSNEKRRRWCTHNTHETWPTQALLAAQAAPILFLPKFGLQSYRCCENRRPQTNGRWWLNTSALFQG